MIAYLDSSVLARAYLVDEDGHQEATALLARPSDCNRHRDMDTDRGFGRAGSCRAGRADEKGLLALLDADLTGPVIVLGAPQEQIEQQALELIRRHALRAMDAWHLAVAALVVPPLLEPREPQAFASRDEAQQKVAEGLGFIAI